MERELGPQQEAIDEAIWRNPHGARRQAVKRVRLISTAAHQGGEGELHALRGVALEDKGIERIECNEVLVELSRRPELREGTALRRVRIDVIEMLEVRGIFEVAEGRHAVALGLLLCLCRRGQDQRGEGAC